MSSLKDLRTRISSVTSTRKITRAMQMVSAAKLRRAQSEVESARPYADNMSLILRRLACETGLCGLDHPLAGGRGADQVHLLLVCTSERGLCGAFNSNIVRLASRHANRLLLEGKTVKILCVGKRGLEQLVRLFPGKIMDNVSMPAVDGSVFDFASLLSNRLSSLFDEGRFDVCTLFFSYFHSVISQVPTARQLIPLSLEDKKGESFEKEDGSTSFLSDRGLARTHAASIYSYEPGESEVFSFLLPRNIGVQIFMALLENAASEQGARMTAMDNATRNAGDMLDKLRLKYNRQRQAKITTELIEVVSGAEAL